MDINMIIGIVLVAVFVLVVGVGLYFYLRNKTLEDVREDAYKLFLAAEHHPVFGASGKQKMKWVLSQVRELLPVWARLLITDALLEKVVQAWFDAVKDLLDDGKLNGTGK